MICLNQLLDNPALSEQKLYDLYKEFLYERTVTINLCEDQAIYEVADLKATNHVIECANHFIKLRQMNKAIYIEYDETEVIEKMIRMLASAFVISISRPVHEQFYLDVAVLVEMYKNTQGSRILKMESLFNLCYAHSNSYFYRNFKVDETKSFVFMGNL
jgi:hypothetical protein